MKHTHNFREADWPFDCAVDEAVVTTKFVVNGERPIVEVLHWQDGGWQFMCNSTDDADKDGVVVCMGCLFQKYPWISNFKGLKKGYMAYFDNQSNLWQVEKIE